MGGLGGRSVSSGVHAVPSSHHAPTTRAPTAQPLGASGHTRWLAQRLRGEGAKSRSLRPSPAGPAPPPWSPALPADPSTFHPGPLASGPLLQPVFPPQLCRPPSPLPAQRILEGQQRGDFPGHVSTSPCSFLLPRSPLHTASFRRPGPFAAGTRGSRRPSEGMGRAAHSRIRSTASGVDTGVRKCEFTSPLLGRLG